MCLPDHEIHFCSCASLEPIPYPDKEFNLQQYTKTHFVWRLKRYIGKKDSGMLGEMIMPLQRISYELTADHLIIELTRKDIFDFDYTPREGDNLIIQEGYIYKSIKGQSRPQLTDYMSLVYRAGTWQDDFYDVFSERTRSFKKGIIKIKSVNNKTSEVYLLK